MMWMQLQVMRFKVRLKTTVEVRRMLMVLGPAITVIQVMRVIRRCLVIKQSLRMKLQMNLEQETL